MTRFLQYSLLGFLFAISVVACTNGPDDRTAYLSSLTFTVITEVIEDGETVPSNKNLGINLELTPRFDPRTLTYTVQANCATDSVDVLAFGAYPGISLLVDGNEPESIVTPVNIPISTASFLINLTGESYIETTYDITITPSDSSVPPVIILDGDFIVNHTLNAPFDKKATACENAGDIPAENIVYGGGTDDEGTVDVNTLGTYILTYDVIDSNELAAAQVIRTVNVVTNTAPVITLIGSSSVSVIQNDEYIDEGATAFDAQEGDLTGIAIINPVNTSIVGTYEVTYDVTDVGGLSATQVIRTVTVIEP